MTLTITSVSVTTLLIILAINYQREMINIENLLAQKLSAIVKTTSLQIDPALHLLIFEKIKNKDLNLKDFPPFDAVRRVLTKSQQANGLASELHILSFPDWAPEYMIFTVMGSQHLYIGNKIARHPLAVKALNSGLSQISNIHLDRSGSWISVFTPLKTKNGINYAVLEGNYDLTNELAAARTGLIKNLIFAFLVTIIFSIVFSLMLAARFTAPILSLIEKAKQLAAGDHSVKTDYKYNDEIESLFHSFGQLVAEVNESNLYHKKLIKELKDLIQLPLQNPNPVIKISPDGVIIFANPSAKNMASRIIITGMPLSKLSPGFSDIKVSSIIKNSENIEIDCTIENKVYIFNFYGVTEANCLLAFGYDITKERDLLNQVKDAQERSIHSERLASLGELSSGIAHEICNPLAIIQGFNSRIINSFEKGKMLDQEQLLNINTKINNGVVRIEKIIRSMKTAARNGENDNHDTVSIKSMFATTFDFVSEQLKQQGIEVSIDSFDESLTIECKEVQISQCMIVLINNARDAIKDLNKVSKKWIRVNAKETNNHIVITVTDSGSGIPLEIQNKMFNSFFTTKDLGSGTGLGLSITEKYIKQHHGKIYVNNNCPNTQIVIELPKRQRHSSGGEVQSAA